MNTSLIEIATLAFSINAPIQLIITIGQWLLIARFLNPPNKTISNTLLCLVVSYISAYLIALGLWLFWPIDPELILYHNRISIPAVLGEMIAIPFWLKQFGFFKPEANK